MECSIAQAFPSLPGLVQASFKPRDSTQNVLSCRFASLSSPSTHWSYVHLLLQRQFLWQVLPISLPVSCTAFLADMKLARLLQSFCLGFAGLFASEHALPGSRSSSHLLCEECKLCTGEGVRNTEWGLTHVVHAPSLAKLGPE